MTKDGLTAYSEPAQFLLHPTDFSEHSELAFAHALRLALTNNANLSLMHVGGELESDWGRFPAIRRTLQQWGLLESGASRADISKLGLGIDKLIAHESDVVDAISGYFSRHPIDLLVVATEGRRGFSAWLKPSTAERAARRVPVPTLFVPADSRGCVSLEDGAVTLDQVIVPVDHHPRSDAAIERGLRAMQAYGHANSQLTLLHVGGDSFPEVSIPDGPWHVVRAVRQGNPLTEILTAADECMANLLIMVTEGSHGFLDVLRGTTTEQVLRQSPCPLLAVPANG